MKAGFNVGWSMAKKEIIIGKTYLMMEDFMTENKIEDSQDVLSNIQTIDQAVSLGCWCRYGIKEFFNGDIGDIKLREFIYHLERETLSELKWKYQRDEDDDAERTEQNSDEKINQAVAESKEENDWVVRRETDHDPYEDEIDRMERENTYQDSDDEVDMEILTEDDANFAQELAGGEYVIPRALKNEAVEKFMFAGKARITIQNIETGNRFTYQIKKLKDKDIWFISLLTGSNNDSDYSFFGTVFSDKMSCKHSKKSRIGIDASGVQAFGWLIKHYKNLPDNVRVWHNGYCGRCGKTLTVPESIVSGFGPTCVGLMS